MPLTHDSIVDDALSANHESIVDSALRDNYDLLGHAFRLGETGVDTGNRYKPTNTELATEAFVPRSTVAQQVARTAPNPQAYLDEFNRGVESGKARGIAQFNAGLEQRQREAVGQRASENVADTVVGAVPTDVLKNLTGHALGGAANLLSTVAAINPLSPPQRPKEFNTVAEAFNRAGSSYVNDPINNTAGSIVGMAPQLMTGELAAGTFAIEAANKKKLAFDEEDARRKLAGLKPVDPATRLIGIFGDAAIQGLTPSFVKGFGNAGVKGLAIAVGGMPAQGLTGAALNKAVGLDPNPFTAQEVLSIVGQSAATGGILHGIHSLGTQSTPTPEPSPAGESQIQPRTVGIELRDWQQKVDAVRAMEPDGRAGSNPSKAQIVDALGVTREDAAKLRDEAAQEPPKQPIPSVPDTPSAVKETATPEITPETEKQPQAQQSASWVVREKATGKPVLETFDPTVAAKINTEKYEVVPILEHLQSLNESTKPNEPSPPISGEPQGAETAAPDTSKPWTTANQIPEGAIDWLKQRGVSEQDLRTQSSKTLWERAEEFKKADARGGEPEKLGAAMGIPLSLPESLKAPLERTKETLGNLWNGETLPKTHAFDRETGESLARVGAASRAQEDEANYQKRLVLPKAQENDLELRQRIGEVQNTASLKDTQASHLANEARLRNQAAVATGAQQTKLLDEAQQYADMAKGIDKNLPGGKNNLFKTDAEYQAALNDPRVQGALKGYKAGTDTWMNKTYRTTAGLDPTDTLPAPATDTGVRSNLLAIQEEPQPTPAGTKRGDIYATKKTFDANRLSRTGTAENGYEKDIFKQQENTVRQKFEKAAKIENAYQMNKSGAAEITSEGGEPQALADVPTVKREIKLPMANGGQAKMDLHVRAELADEFDRAHGLDKPFQPGIGAKILNTAQMVGVVEPVAHVMNNVRGLMSNELGADAKSAIAKKGFTPVTFSKVIGRIYDAAVQQHASSPETERVLAETAKEGTGRPASGTFSRVLDRTMRLAAHNQYQEAVKSGLIPASENTSQNMREWLNRVSGQYNAKLIPRWMSVMKESGWAPFIVAHTTYGRLGLKNAIGEVPRGVDNPKQLQRAQQMFATWAAPALTAALINYISGDKEKHALGETGMFGLKDKNGKPLKMQFYSLTGATRAAGGAITDLMEGKRAGQSDARIIDKMAVDIARQTLGTVEGPLSTVGKTMLSHVLPEGDEMATPKADTAAGETQIGVNAKQAAKTFNPFAKSLIEGATDATGPVDAAKGAAGSLLKTLGGSFGVNTKKTAQPEDISRLNDAYIKHVGSGDLTEAEKQDFAARAAFRQAMRSGLSEPSALIAAAKKLGVTDKEIAADVKRSGMDENVFRFRAIPLEDAKRVMEAASTENKKLFEIPFAVKKLNNEISLLRPKKESDPDAADRLEVLDKIHSHIVKIQKQVVNGEMDKIEARDRIREYLDDAKD